MLSWLGRSSPRRHRNSLSEDIVDGGSHRSLSVDEIVAYGAPFPDDTYKAGARIFPTLVPTSTDDPAAADNAVAWDVLSKFTKPFLCAFSDRDMVTAGGEAPFKTKIPGAQGQSHTTIVGGGHFLQEDCPEELAGLIIKFMTQTPPGKRASTNFVPRPTSMFRP